MTRSGRWADPLTFSARTRMGRTPALSMFAAASRLESTERLLDDEVGNVAPPNETQARKQTMTTHRSIPKVIVFLGVPLPDLAPFGSIMTIVRPPSSSR